MDKRRQTLLYTLVFVTGFFGLVLTNELWPGKLPFLGDGLEAEVQADFRETWLPLLKPDLRVSRILDDHPEFFEHWGGLDASIRPRWRTCRDMVSVLLRSVFPVASCGQPQRRDSPYPCQPRPQQRHATCNIVNSQRFLVVTTFASHCVKLEDW